VAHFHPESGARFHRYTHSEQRETTCALFRTDCCLLNGGRTFLSAIRAKPPIQQRATKLVAHFHPESGARFHWDTHPEQRETTCALFEMDCCLLNGGRTFLSAIEPNRMADRNVRPPLEFELLPFSFSLHLITKKAPGFSGSFLFLRRGKNYK